MREMRYELRVLGDVALLSRTLRGLERYLSFERGSFQLIDIVIGGIIPLLEGAA